jgi:hypothetical protein
MIFGDFTTNSLNRVLTFVKTILAVFQNVFAAPREDEERPLTREEIQEDERQAALRSIENSVEETRRTEFR